MTRSEFELIAQELRTRMLKVALDFFGNRNDAEDVAQDAMLQLWRFCEQIDDNRNVSGLAVRVAKNCCVSHYRKQQVEQRLKDSDYGSAILHKPDPSDTPIEHLEAEDTRQLMTEVMACLKPRERELFELRRMDGFSIREISEQTGISERSVSAIVSAARWKVFVELKKRMKQ